jgi:hypothetical protein
MADDPETMPKQERDARMQLFYEEDVKRRQAGREAAEKPPPPPEGSQS